MTPSQNTNVTEERIGSAVSDRMFVDQQYAQNRIVVIFTLSQKSSGSAAIYDLTGAKVAQTEPRVFDRGTVALPVEMRSMAMGIRYCALSIGMRRVIVRVAFKE